MDSASQMIGGSTKQFQASEETRMEKTLYADTLVGENIIITTSGRDPAMTRLWWTTPRSGGMQSRDGGDYSDVAITGELTQASINNIDGHSRMSVVAVEIGNTVTSIGSGAFSDCGGLASVTIPGSVTSIGTWTFYHCDGLTSIVIPSSVATIGDWAFGSCGMLTQIAIHGYTSIGMDAFYGCGVQEMYVTNMPTIYILDNFSGWSLGFDSYENTHMVVVYCSDGTVVLNGNSGDSSSSMDGSMYDSVIYYDDSGM